MWTLSRRVRTLRRAAHLTQNALAERASVRVAFIQRVERGEGNPSLATMVLFGDWTWV